MFDLPGPLGTFANFLVIAAGFGFIIFIHELGHFLAAKWAGIRVLAFSIGFGQIVCSYRKGIGFRRGSSESEYRKRAYGLSSEQIQQLHNEISPTEYRLSWLPLGGYVKMLGQEDLNPDATSPEPDSYQNCSVPKRMVVISAGVIMNVISAAILFVIVFNAGLRVFPAKAGYIAPDGPAALAQPVNRDDVGIGLQRGDRITAINGRKMYSFEHILPEVAMSAKGSPISIVVEREGIEGTIEYSTLPVKNPMTGLLGIRIDPPITTEVKATDDPKLTRQIAMFASEYGLGSLLPGDRIVGINAEPARSPLDLIEAAERSGGESFQISVERDEKTHRVQIQPARELMDGAIATGDGLSMVEHVLGLSGVMMVNPHAAPEDTRQGLMPADIFAKLGHKSFPSVDEGIEIVRANAGKPMKIEVLRGTPQSGYQRVELDVEVNPDGTIGFYPVPSTGYAPFVRKPARIAPMPEAGAEPPTTDPVPQETPASGLIEYPGSRVRRVGETSIGTLRDVVDAVIGHTKPAFDAGEDSFVVPVTLELPLPVQPDGSIPTTTREWQLTRDQVEALHELGWSLPGGSAMAQLFTPEQIIDRSPTPLAAINRGIAESRRVMMQTYLTFLRLFQGSVQVTHLKGPVGIAHLGTQIASQGFIWVLFFMALISINLAVINFLPLPIVDGGQFLMLCYEWLRGRPVPIVVQNVATMAGLLLIGFVFLYVTFNDIKTIFGL